MGDVDKEVETDEVPAINKQINTLTEDDSPHEGNKKGGESVRDCRGLL